MVGGIAAGSLNRHIEVFKDVWIQDETGQRVKNYELDFETWANITPVRGMEKMQAGREELQTMMHRVKVRFDDRYTATHLLKYDGIFWDIQSMSTMGRLNREVIEFLTEQIETDKVIIRPS